MQYSGRVTVHQLPSCLWEPSAWVNYSSWKSHLSSSPWAPSSFGLLPSPFWNLVASNWLWCPPSPSAAEYSPRFFSSKISLLPYLLPFLLILGFGESLWTSDTRKSNLKVSVGERESDKQTDRHICKDTDLKLETRRAGRGRKWEAEGGGEGVLGWSSILPE